MKKVLIAFDGTHMSEGAFEFARQLNEQSPILLIGVFIPQVNYANLWSYSNAVSGSVFVPMMEEENGTRLENNVLHFEELCRQNDIEFSVHKDYYDFALPELRRETRFADLLIISSEQFFENFPKADSDFYMRETLHEAECPVIIVPEKFDFPQTNILAYNGKEPSVYAIKQFAYLFPEMAENRTVLVYCGDDNGPKMPEEDNIRELTETHYKNLELTKLDINPKKYFATWVSENKASILISGSFGRSGFSEIFRKNFVSEAISQHKIPIFIAHR